MACALEDLPGISVFSGTTTGASFPANFAYSHECEVVPGSHPVLNLTSEGRDQAGLSQPMAWVRYHDHCDEDY